MKAPIGIFALLAVFASVPVNAADYWADEPFKLRPAIHDWTGGYAGVHGGWGWGDHSGSFRATGEPDNGAPYSFARRGAISGDGMVAGVQSGYGAQLDTLYFGIEADLSYARIDGTRTWTFTVEDVEIEPGVFESIEEAVMLTGRTDWLGTFRGRVGLPLDNVLIYGTGGLAVGGVRMLGFGDTHRSTRVGWTGGGGVELAFGGNWSMRGEYLYYDLGKKDYSVSGLLPAPAGGPITVTGEVDFTGHVVRAGLNYRFD